jgi:NitT/TauT family transport system ATP-binding protein
MSIPAQPAMNLKPWTNAMGVYEPAQRYAFELLTIWRESRKTILFVTHGIAEAVFLGTRVVVLTAGPARMAADIEIELPRPRTLELKTDARFGEYTRRIYHLLGLE